ncbi:hypothetical protein WR25_12212 [Diploscapter pachys]|uniref:Uncharacterized protein n=1 Tax=Diploscapter pachys TaxID=2018661 RepID=A0A2A2LWS5_9BILA|nr:hypothetical protein WR25_12212 [Diploscapter pachys]
MSSNLIFITMNKRESFFGTPFVGSEHAASYGTTDNDDIQSPIRLKYNNINHYDAIVEMDHMDALGESAEDYSSLDDLSDTQDEESDEDWEKDVKAMMRRIRWLERDFEESELGGPFERDEDMDSEEAFVTHHLRRANAAHRKVNPDFDSGKTQSTMNELLRLEVQHNGKLMTMKERMKLETDERAVKLGVACTKKNLPGFLASMVCVCMCVIVWREVMFVYLLVVLPGYPARDNRTTGNNLIYGYLKIFPKLSLK